MSVESWAQKIVQDELQESVVVHDDNSQPSMYDLRIGPADSPAIAIECVGAVDSVRTETWNLGPGRGPRTLALHGDWTVFLKPTAKIKGLTPGLEAIVQDCEREGVPSPVHVDWHLNRSNPKLFSALDSIGVTFLSCFRVDGKGKVHLTMDGIGGAVDSEGLAIPGWIIAFLTDPKRADVVSKLALSGAPNCHAFVIVDYAGAPWSVQSYLDGDLVSLPPAPPRLPSPLTGAWLVSTSNTSGVRWTGTHWKRFNAERYGA
jgi:hypothetical protein